MNKHDFLLQVEELNSGSPELAAHVPSQPAYEEARGAVIGCILQVYTYILWYTRTIFLYTHMFGNRVW